MADRKGEQNGFNIPEVGWQLLFIPANSAVLAFRRLFVFKNDWSVEIVIRWEQTGSLVSLKNMILIHLLLGNCLSWIGTLA